MPHFFTAEFIVRMETMITLIYWEKENQLKNTYKVFQETLWLSLTAMLKLIQKQKKVFSKITLKMQNFCEFYKIFKKK